jgi:hypothetical protein
LPRYFFDLADHGGSPDEEGTELADASAARTEAVQFAGQCLLDHPEFVWDGHEIQVIVRDGSGGTIFSVVTFSMDGEG